MCTYNGENYIREQIESIINQTYPIFEILIQDDCSSDSTVNIVKEYTLAYPHIHLFQNSKNMGVNANFRDVFYKTKGDYISVSDQDDIWLPNKIEQMVLYINEFAMVVSNSCLFGENISKSLLFEAKPNYSSIAILLKNGVFGHTALFNKNILPDNMLSWNYHLDYDTDIGLIASAKGGVYYIDEVLTLWRRHSLCVSGKSIGPIRNKAGIFGYYEVMRALFDKNQKNKVAKHFMALKSLFKDSKELSPIVCYLSKPSIINLICCGFYCVRFRNELEPEMKNSVLKLIRGFSIPFFKYRDLR